MSASLQFGGGRQFGFAAWVLIAASVAAHADQIDCIVNPSATIKVGSPISTTLSKVNVERGDHLKRGQVIAELDSGVEAADIALARARAASTAEIDRARSKEDFATVEYRRGQALRQNIPAQKLDELRSNLIVAQQERIIAEHSKALAELDLARVEALFQQRIIRSPVDGVVTQRLLSPGEYVHQDNQIAIIAVNSPLYVEAYPPVNLWPTIHAGDTATVNLTEPANMTKTAKVTIVDQVFDPASGTFGLRLELANADGALPAGQRCRLSFQQSGTSQAVR